jgi:hypothetical protein
MNFFKCCHKCTKRYPGCHSKCSDYIKAKKSSDALKSNKIEYIEGPSITRAHKAAIRRKYTKH